MTDPVKFTPDEARRGYAWRNHGAIYGDGIGPMGTSYAIPTKDAKLRTLPHRSIQPGYNCTLSTC